MKPLTVALRVTLTVLVVFGAVKLGITLGPRLAQAGTTVSAGRGAAFTSLSAAESRSPQPDWGGGELSFPGGSAASVVDSARAAAGDSAGTHVWSGPEGGVVVRQTSDSDYAVTLAMPVRDGSGRVGVFDLPSASHFREQLLPKPGEAEPPAPDIPLYPGASCHTQVGRGTACFVGFYLTPDSIEAVREFYVRSLARLGWQRVTADEQGAVETFARRNQDRMLVVQMRRQDAATTRIGLVAMTSGSPDGKERK